MITLEQLQKIIPYAGLRAGVFLVPLNEAMAEFGIDTPMRQAAFLAQVAHESGSLRYVREIASGLDYNGRKDLGNTRPEAIRIAAEHGSTPGPWWNGHGLIQITGYDNHLACGRALCLDLLHQPRLLEQPVHAARSAAWFWSSRNLNALADAGRFRTITLAINGGLNGYEDRRTYYERAQTVLS